MRQIPSCLSARRQINYKFIQIQSIIHVKPYDPENSQCNPHHVSTNPYKRINPTQHLPPNIRSIPKNIPGSLHTPIFEQTHTGLGPLVRPQDRGKIPRAQISPRVRTLVKMTIKSGLSTPRGRGGWGGGLLMPGRAEWNFTTCPAESEDNVEGVAPPLHPPRQRWQPLRAASSLCVYLLYFVARYKRKLCPAAGRRGLLLANDRVVNLCYAKVARLYRSGCVCVRLPGRVGFFWECSDGTLERLLSGGRWEEGVVFI